MNADVEKVVSQPQRLVKETTKKLLDIEKNEKMYHAESKNNAQLRKIYSKIWTKLMKLDEDIDDE